jgi:hypothetical protein
MASRFAHAAVFAVGAAVGAGVTAALVRSKRPEPLAVPSPQGIVQSQTPSLMQAATKGAPIIVQSPVPPSEIIQFFGNPGQLQYSLYLLF